MYNLKNPRKYTRATSRWNYNSISSNDASATKLLQLSENGEIALTHIVNFTANTRKLEMRTKPERKELQLDKYQPLSATP